MSFRLLPLALALAAALISVDAGKSCETNEEYKTCGPSIEPTCDNHEQHLPMDKKCNVGCFCKEDYVRDAHGNCIPKKSCPIPCPDNSAYSPHGGSQATCLKPRPVTSTKPGCYCNPKFVLDSTTNTCIPWQKCPCFGQNQIYSDCVPIYPKTCSHRSNSKKHDMCLENWKACICKDGYALNDDKVCVPFKECPPTPCEGVAIKCPPNSTPTKCKKQCPSKCPSKFKELFVCLPNKKCQPGCDCNKGYVLNNHNQCVLPKDCPSDDTRCLPGLHYENSSRPQTCEDLTLDSLDYKKGCFCKSPLVFDPVKKQCVTADDCSVCPELSAQCHKHDPNSVYSKSHICERCCTDLTPNPLEQCTNECICKDGYVRGIDNKCIPVAECPVKCGPNSTYREYVNQCGRTCKTHHMAPYILCALLKNPGCDCDENYVTNEETGECVLIADCPSEECPPDTHKEKCSRPRTCEDIGRKKEVEGCFCKEPLVYHEGLKKCVNSALCPNSPENLNCLSLDPNSEYVTSHICERSCTDTSPPIKTKCGKGCVCKERFVRNAQWECVPKNECLTCGSNATYTDSVDTCGRTCGTYNLRHLIQCEPPLPVPGCNCNEGFVLNSNGQCVVIDDCTGEELGCPPKTHFEVSHKPKTCNDVNTKNYENKKGCFCDKAKVYDEVAFKCVAPEKCAFYQQNRDCQAHDINSVFVSCASSTNITCENPNGPMTKDCRQRCVCKEGYIYKSKTELVCIPADQCKPPKPVCTKLNTVYKKLCGPQPTCDEPHPLTAPKKCINGCFCKDGYVLNTLSNCIPLNTCPEPTCPTNQTYKACAQVCRKTCETQYLDLAFACRCQPGCECDPGYISDNQGNCILPKDCNPEVVKCPANMHYQQCITGNTCTGPIYYFACQPGCVCDEGFVTDDNGKCIPKSECPKIIEPECPVNQTYKECSLCGRSCGNYYQNIMFKCKCVPGCACEEGYIWNSKKECVAVKDCTKEETKCQETQEFCYNQVQKTCEHPNGNGVVTSGCFCKEGLLYDEDSRTCVTAEKCLEHQNQKCQAEDPNTEYVTSHLCERPCTDTCTRTLPRPLCGPGCVCKSGFVRNDQGQCVPFKDCLNCGPNATYSEVVYTCSRTCGSYYMAPYIRCPAPPKEPGCNCNEGFVLNAKGECVVIDDCTEAELACPSITHYEECKRLKTCKDVITNNLSPKKGCFCDEPHVYDEATLQCILPEDCLCRHNDPNSEFTKCGLTKNFTCDDPKGLIPSTCEPKCICKSGYILKSKTEFVCIPTKECPSRCGANKYYSECYVSVDTCNGTQTFNSCQIGCVCKFGFVQDDNGNCIPQKGCPVIPTCPGNQTYSECANCGRNCYDYYVNYFYKCACKPGCGCKEGFIWNSKRECVAVEDCIKEETICQETQKFKYNHVRKTCKYPQENGVKTSGCFCKDDLVFDEDTKTCIDAAECLDSKENKKCQKIKPNSEFKTCQPGVIETCSGNVYQTGVCEPDCYCKPGYKLNSHGQCVEKC